MDAAGIGCLSSTRAPSEDAAGIGPPRDRRAPTRYSRGRSQHWVSGPGGAPLPRARQASALWIDVHRRAQRQLRTRPGWGRLGSTRVAVEDAAGIGPPRDRRAPTRATAKDAPSIGCLDPEACHYRGRGRHRLFGSTCTDARSDNSGRGRDGAVLDRRALQQRTRPVLGSLGADARRRTRAQTWVGVGRWCRQLQRSSRWSLLRELTHDLLSDTIEYLCGQKVLRFLLLVLFCVCYQSYDNSQDF
jgi:hypothetical protein